MKNIMARAHELARTFEGDYQARMSLAMKIAWAEARKMIIVRKVRNIELLDADVEANVWEKHGLVRIYVNHVWKTRKAYNNASIGYFQQEGSTWRFIKTGYGVTRRETYETYDICNALAN